jgi:hypothetical protein
MVQSNVLYFAVLLIFPAFFVFYCIARVIRHYNDGVEKSSRPIVSRQRIKLIFTVLMVLLNIAILLIGYEEITYYTDNTLLVMFTFYVIDSVSWVFSCLLVRFEYTRRLKMSWWG